MSLPIDQYREDILLALRDHQRLLVSAPTGSGKSTGIPPLLYQSGLITGQILVVQPRRIAARLLAQRVAQTLKSPLGQEVGYTVRFDSCAHPGTKIRFVTDGVLLRELTQNPTLEGIGLIVFDEFHERRIDSDLALGHAHRLQLQARPDLKIVVMSATLATSTLQEYLAPVPCIEVQVRSYPVTISYRSARPRLHPRTRRPETPPLWEQIGIVAKEVASQGPLEDWLIFLPGVYEIEKTKNLLAALPALRPYALYPLYGGLTPEKQLRAVDAPGPKIVLATNVAETSLTIPTIKVVIDTGWARQSRYDAQRAVDSLLLRKISQAAADQRAGRAGRTSEGRCYRLWSEADHQRRRAFTPPETETKEISAPLLLLAQLGYRATAQFPPSTLPLFRWLTPPPVDSAQRSYRLLRSLGALCAAGQLTEVGQTLRNFPLDPRLSRLLLAGHQYGCLAETLFIAACLQGEPLVKRTASLGRNSTGNRPAARSKNRISDFEEPGDQSSFAALWRVFEFARSNDFQPQALGAFGLSGRAARELAKSLEQLRALARRAFPEDQPDQPDFAGKAQRTARAVSESFAQQLAVKLGNATLSCRLLGNRKGLLEDSLVARKGTLFLATHLHEIEGREVLTHLSHLVEVTLADLQAWQRTRIVPHREVFLDQSTQKFLLRDLFYYELDEQRVLIGQDIADEPPSPEEVGGLLATMLEKGEATLPRWNGRVNAWIARLNQLGEWRPDLALPSLKEPDLHLLKQSLCAGVRRLKELKDLDPWPLLQDWLSPAQHAVVDHYAPLEMTFKNGLRAKIHYEEGQAPTIAAPLQKLYDLPETPTLCDGEVPLRIEILAPNRRPWQITSDLASFWQNGYPQMKKELAGRYPKHEWR